MILKKLFEPISIKGLMARNRIVMPPMHNNLGSLEEGITDQAIDFFSARAKGGFGMIGIGVIDTYFMAGASSPRAFFLSSDRHRRKHTKAVKAIKKYGALVYAQIGVRRIWPVKELHRLPHLSTIPEDHILKMVDSLVQAAIRVREAGYDALSLLGIGGGAISIFLSQVLNDRTDGWGGSLERRLTFPLKALAGIRAALGEDFPIFFRMHGSEFLPGGYGFETAKVIARHLERAGVDLFNVSGGSHATSVPQLTPNVPRGTYAFLAREIKEAVHVPVSASNRINHPFVAERILQSGWADLVSIARGSLADPEWAEKARKGDFDDIRLCLACNECLDAVVIHEKPICCTVNPRVGLVSEIRPLPRAKPPKRVTVIGGGVTGLQAAVTCAERGHRVSLLEKEPFLGGRWRLASVPPGREELSHLPYWLFRRAKGLGVDLRTGVEASAENVRMLKPEAIIVCTGSRPGTPNIRGIGLPHVVFADQALENSVPIGDKVVVVGGGGVGVETALYLAQRWSLSPESMAFLHDFKAVDDETIESLGRRGHQVTLVEQLNTVGLGLGPGTKWVLLKELQRAKVRVISGAHVQEILQAGVIIRKGTAEEVIPADTVVLATGSEMDTSVYEALRGLAGEVYLPGLGKEVGHTIESLRDAFETALRI
jgi:2,4-dienoyl-CoA reductase (NADPH2)